MRPLLAFSLYFMIFLMVGCRGGCGRSSTVVVDPPQPPPVEDSIPPLERVNFFLENSRSMAGFIYFATDFSENIDQILVGLNSRYRGKVHPFTLGEELGDYEQNIERFRADLNPTNRKKISIENSSLLDRIIYPVIEETKENELSILITDAIMSGSNTDLANYDDESQNLYFNIDNARSRLKGDITTAFDARPDGLALKVLAFRSNFESGKRAKGSKANYYYYKADNNRFSGKLIGNLPNRPYYLFLFGSTDQIRAFEEKTKRLFNPEKTAELGFDYNADIFRLTNACQKRNNTKARSRDKGGQLLHEIEFDGSTNVFRFSFLLNLEDLDPMFQEMDYLQNNLSILINKKEFHFPEVIDPFDVPVNELWFPGTSKTEYENYTHLVTFELEDYVPNAADDFNIRLVNNVDDWVEEWHSDNDLQMDLDDSTTFGLK